MSRWFFPSAPTNRDASSLSVSVTFGATTTGPPIAPVTIANNNLALAGPADVTAIDPSLILREEPPAGTIDARQNIMASVDFAHADLPWLLATHVVTTSAGPQTCPWLALIVLAESEAPAPRPADPTPLIDVPSTLLPPLQDSWAWAHVEGRFDPPITDQSIATSKASDSLRTPTAEVVGRLICPRQLEADTDWIAAVVPIRADLGWPAAASDGTVTLPVFHWWRFRTGDAGAFEDLARRLSVNTTATSSGLGSHTVDVSRPWPDQPATSPAVTLSCDGALRVGSNSGPETWSDATAQSAFESQLNTELATFSNPRSVPAAGSPAPSVGPPVYGATLTGVTGGPPSGNLWMSQVNTEVRRRVAAALGARYVQLEQEFLMARAWEQAGEIKAANRLLAVSELATESAHCVQQKHITSLPTSDLVSLMAPAADRIVLNAAFGGQSGQPVTTMSAAVTTRVPRGLGSTAFSRLARPGGALARRVQRVTSTAVNSTPFDTQSLTANTVQVRSLTGGMQPATMPAEVCLRIDPRAPQLQRMSSLLGDAVQARQVTDSRPLRPIMAHPKFSIPIGAEILSRWPDWAMPGITDLPQDSVTLAGTNPAFVAALLIGLNEAFNRELLWRGFPTDQRGTAFARFWPPSDAHNPPAATGPGPQTNGEIAAWPPRAPLGYEVDGGQATVVVIIRGALMRRFPNTPLVAVPSVGGAVPDDMTQAITATAMRLDDSTVLYLVPGLDKATAINNRWLFVLREPVHSTQFGYGLDSGTDLEGVRETGPPVNSSESIGSWSTLMWSNVPQFGNGYINVSGAKITAQQGDQDLPVWGGHSADMARIAFRQPFQFAIPASDWLSS